MLKTVTGFTLSATFVTTTLIAASGVQAMDLCAKTQTKITESTICGDPSLKLLDDKLNHAYSLARQSVSDKNDLRSMQIKWLRLVRDKCENSKECLSRVYNERIIELVDLFVSSVQVNESPMSNEEAKKSCVALSELADSEELASLEIPGRGQWPIDEKDIKEGWAISQEERANLEARESYLLNEPSTVYKLRLTAKGEPTRFARFFTGGTCASYQVFSIPYLLNYGDDDVDEVEDPDENIRWAYWGGGDYPIFYLGRNYMVTADLGNQNRVNMISWIKPDGRKRPLCLLSVNSTKMKVVSAKNPELCSGIADGTLHPLKWKEITKGLPFSHDTRGYRDEFVKRYGGYADTVSLLSIDIDGEGKLENVGKFEYASGAGCGSTSIWLSILSEDLSEVVRKLINGSVDVYEAEGRYYISATIGNADAGVVQIINERTEQVCELKRQTETSISEFFYSEL